MSIASEDRLCILPGCSVSPTTDFEDRFGVGGYDNIITVEDDDNLSIQNIASHGFYNLAREEDETSSEDVQSWDLHVDILDDDNRTGKWRSRKKIFRNLFLVTSAALAVSLCFYAFVTHARLPSS